MWSNTSVFLFCRLLLEQTFAGEFAVLPMKAKAKPPNQTKFCGASHVQLSLWKRMLRNLAIWLYNFRNLRLGARNQCKLFLHRVFRKPFGWIQGTKTVFLVNHAFAWVTPSISVIFVVSRGLGSKALGLLVRTKICHFRHFFLFGRGQRHGLPKAPLLTRRTDVRFRNRGHPRRKSPVFLRPRWWGETF